MNVSPVQFAREYEQLKTLLAANVADDSRLTRLIDFHRKYDSVLKKAQFESYRLEIRQLAESLTTAASIKDLPPQTLFELLDFTDSLKLKPQSEIVAYRLAQVHCYVGEFVKAANLLRKRRGLDSLKPPENPEPLVDREGLLSFCERLEQLDSSAHDVLKRIHADWTITAEELRHDQAYCLFVEADGNSGDRMGRLKVLRGSVELSGKSVATDEITFENQIKAPDDPFVGSAYNAFAALREFFVAHGYKDRGSRFFHAHFSVIDSRQTFTGDSIGLAVGAVTFAGLMKTEITRHERLISQEVAFTGGVDDTGRITPVNETTLRQKIARAFFSHIRFVVLPKENLRAAEDIVAELANAYPHRTLHLVGYEKLSDVIEDKNILRSEKVCIGELVARKAVYYTRVSRMQVPLLLILAYLLLSLIYPKAWIWFDDNPQWVRPTKAGFTALNADSTSLWTWEFDCDTLNCSRNVVYDLDGDGKNEVAVLPSSMSGCSCNCMLYVYDYKGNMLFERDAVILNQYKVDSTRSQPYNAHELKVIRFMDETLILTNLTISYHARAHIRFWSISGELNGWYVDAGTLDSWPKMNAAGVCEKVLFCGINNPTGSACIFTLPRDSARGAGPPLGHPGYDILDAKPGNQLTYIVFPPSDFCLALRNQYNRIMDIKTLGTNLLAVNVDENLEDPKGQRHIKFVLDSNLRVIAAQGSDNFMRARERLVDDGKLPPMLDTVDYFNKLRDLVKYWTDSGWVTEGAFRAAAQ